MDTLDTMEEPTVEAKLLDALSRLNDRRIQVERQVGRHPRGNALRTKSQWVVTYYPTLAEWLKETGFQDTDENRWTYYAIMGELIQQGLITVSSESYGTACWWHRYALNNVGHERLNLHRMQKAL